MASAFQKALRSLSDLHEQEVAYLRAELLRARCSDDGEKALQSTWDEAPGSLRQSAEAQSSHPRMCMPGEAIEESHASDASREVSPRSPTFSQSLTFSEMQDQHLLKSRDAGRASSSSSQGLDALEEDSHPFHKAHTEPLPMARRNSEPKAGTSENGSRSVKSKVFGCSNENQDLEVVEMMELSPVWHEIAHMKASYGFGTSDKEQVMARMSCHPTKSSSDFEENPAYKGYRKGKTLTRSKSQFFNKSRRVSKFYDRHDTWTICSMDNFVSSPLSKRRLAWDFAGLAFLFYDLIMVPIQVFEPEESSAVAAMNIITCSFWTGDMFASFFVGYHTNGHVEMRPRMIAKHYIKSWFSLDIVLVVTDWIFLVMGLEAKARFMRLGKVAKCARVLRLCRIMKFHMLVADMADQIHSEYQRTLLGIGRLLLFIVAINHFIACAWYGLHHLREGETWVKKNFDQDDGLGMRYWTSMHWSMTQFTPASMEVVPVNSMERFYTVCVLVFALVTFSSFVSSITQSMTHLRNINARELEQQSNLHRYLAEHTISSQLVNRILHFIRDRKNYARKPTRMKEVDVALFQELPESVKMELRTEVHVPIITVHPLFYNYNLADPAAMRHICKNALQEKTLLQREELFAESAGANQAVFMNEGRLIYTYPTRDFLEAKAYIGKSEWVCEAFLWARNADLFGPLVAEISSEMVLLGSHEFVSIVKRYEGSAKQIARYAELFVREVNKGLAECRWASILCNNFDYIRDLAQLAFEGPNENEEEVMTEKLPHEHRSSLVGTSMGAYGLDSQTFPAALRPGEFIRTITDWVTRNSTPDVSQGRTSVSIHAVDIERHSQVNDFPVRDAHADVSDDCHSHSERRSGHNYEQKMQTMDENAESDFARANSSESLS